MLNFYSLYGNKTQTHKLAATTKCGNSVTEFEIKNYT